MGHVEWRARPLAGGRQRHHLKWIPSRLYAFREVSPLYHGNAARHAMIQFSGLPIVFHEITALPFCQHSAE